MTRGEGGAQQRQNRLQPRRWRRFFVVIADAWQARSSARILQVAVDRETHELPGDIGDEQRAKRRRRGPHRALLRRARHFRRCGPYPGQQQRPDHQSDRAQHAGYGAGRQLIESIGLSGSRRPVVAVIPLGQPVDHDHQEQDAKRGVHRAVIAEQVQRQAGHEGQEKPGNQRQPDRDPRPRQRGTNGAEEPGAAPSADQRLAATARMHDDRRIEPANHQTEDQSDDVGGPAIFIHQTIAGEPDEDDDRQRDCGNKHCQMTGFGFAEFDQPSARIGWPKDSPHDQRGDPPAHQHVGGEQRQGRGHADNRQKVLPRGVEGHDKQRQPHRIAQQQHQHVGQPRPAFPRRHPATRVAA
jgi:hypothetical protein